MGTTHVVRDESWLSTLPFHIQLFAALGFKLPKYCHTAQVLKLDNGNKRKISKRKDPEAALTFYYSEGYPTPALREYLLTLLNSNFEEWRIANPDLPIEKFGFTTKKMPISGSLFDLDKLNDISKNVISRLTADEVYENTLAWAKEFDPEFAAVLSGNREKAVRILGVGRGGKKPRKDITLWSGVKHYVSFFYDTLFTREDEIPEGFERNVVNEVLADYAKHYTECADNSEWFAAVKDVAARHGFCPDMKDYKANPGAYKGSVADVSMFIRVAVTGRLNSPDLFEVMSILGRETVINRINDMMR